MQNQALFYLGKDLLLLHDQWKKLNSTADIEMTVNSPETASHILK